MGLINGKPKGLITCSACSNTRGHLVTLHHALLFVKCCESTPHRKWIVTSRARCKTQTPGPHTPTATTMIAASKGRAQSVQRVRSRMGPRPPTATAVGTGWQLSTGAIARPACDKILLQQHRSCAAVRSLVSSQRKPTNLALLMSSQWPS